MKRIPVRDKLGPAQVKRLVDAAKAAVQTLSPEGFLRATALIFRTGIQEYTRLELGLDASMDVVRLYRSPDEVFAPEAMASFEGQTITFYHPESKNIDSDNWKANAVGDFWNVARDEGDDTFGRADLIVRDGGSVQSIAYGVKELSAGYSFELVMTPGTTPDGQAYDGLQTNIRGNHLAIVYQGRCGGGCAIGDCACQAHQPQPTRTEDHTMKIKIGNFEINVADDNHASIIQGAIADRDAQIGSLTTARDQAADRATKAETALVTQGEAMKTAAADHRVETDRLKTQIPTEAAIGAMAFELSTVIGDAKAVNPEFKMEGAPSAHQIRVAVLGDAIAKDEKSKAIVTKLLAGVDLAKADAPIVRAAFDVVVSRAADAVKETGTGPTEREIGDALTGNGTKKGADAAAPKKLGGRALMIARGMGRLAQ